MMNGGFGIGAGVVWLFVLLFWAVLLAVIVFAVVKLLPSGTPASPAAPTPGALAAGESPEQLLDRLFAVGEIDEATYRARRTALAEMRGQQS
jgi:putative membrane protein